MKYQGKKVVMTHHVNLDQIIVIYLWLQTIVIISFSWRLWFMILLGNINLLITLFTWPDAIKALFYTKNFISRSVFWRLSGKVIPNNTPSKYKNILLLILFSYAFPVGWLLSRFVPTEKWFIVRQNSHLELKLFNLLQKAVLC